MKIKLTLLMLLVFHGAAIAGQGYKGLICNDTKEMNVSVSKLQADNYNGYDYLQFKREDSTLFGAYL